MHSAERLQDIINILNISRGNNPYILDEDEYENGEGEEPEQQNEIQPASPIQTEIQEVESQDDADAIAVAVGQMTLSPARQDPPREPEAPPSEERQKYHTP